MSSEDAGKQANADAGSQASGGTAAPSSEQGSPGAQLQATLLAADEAARELLDAAREEARQHVEAVRQAAVDSTAELQARAQALLTRANEVVTQTQELGEATRELTASLRDESAVEAEGVVELEDSSPLELTTATAEPGEAVVVVHDDDAEEPSPRRSIFRRFRRRREPDSIPIAETPPLPEPPADGAPPPEISAGARLVANEMLSAGLGAEEVERRLRSQFRIAHAAAVIESLRESPPVPKDDSEEAS